MYGCVYGHGFCVDREERGRGEPQGSPSAEQVDRLATKFSKETCDCGLDASEAKQTTRRGDLSDCGLVESRRS